MSAAVAHANRTERPKPALSAVDRTDTTIGGDITTDDNNREGPESPLPETVDPAAQIAKFTKLLIKSEIRKVCVKQQKRICTRGIRHRNNEGKSVIRHLDTTDSPRVVNHDIKHN